MENKDFVVFILTHGRPNNVLTKKTLDKCGYTGKTYLIIDNEDKTAEEYKSIFKEENVIVFDKKKYADLIDEGNNFDNRKVIVHARNACFDIAKELGYNYFLVLDDDYYEINYTLLGYKYKLIKKLDSVFALMFDFLIATSSKTIAFAQTGDFIGGIDNGKGVYRFNKRKCMNSFFCRTDKPFQFVGSINEDVNTYVTLGSRGELFLTIPSVAINQKDTQTNKGGMTDIYMLSGTYIKAFHTVMMHPSSVKVSMMNANHKRVHHSINWKATTPMIIREKYKK